MNYKELYVGLCELLIQKRVQVLDFDVLGFCLQTKGLKGIIHISPRLSYKHRFLVLCHEAGHLFSVNKNGIFKWRENPSSEEEANDFARKFLTDLDINIKEFNSYYKKTAFIKPKHKSWIEIL